ncbi:MAG: GIY-YIG nuclease family protein [Patescibacteria group bacterium]
MYYVYYLRSLSSNESYIGSTKDLKRRVKEHNDGKSFSTKRYRPWQLQYYEAFHEESLARMREHNLKHNGNALRELKKRLTLSSSKKSNKQGGAGFTLIEVIIAVGISVGLLAFVLANYYRGGDDSALNKETSLLMSRIRFAQEEANSGKTFGYCYHFTGTSCTGNGPRVCSNDLLKACPLGTECGPGNSCVNATTSLVCSNDPYRQCSVDGDCANGGTCRYSCDPNNNIARNCCPGGTGLNGVCPTGNETPTGGFVISLACPGGYTKPGGYDETEYPFLTNGASMYGLFAERRTCGSASASAPTLCFPPRQTAALGAFDDTAIGSDGIVSAFTFLWGAPSGSKGQKGDTAQERYVLDPKVVVKDLQLVSQNAVPGATGTGKIFRCTSGDNPGGGTPWRGKTVSTAGNSLVPNNYPLQVAIRFIPPDGRSVMLTDNIAINPPGAGSDPDPNNAWVSADVMLGLVKRPNSDCHVVTMTRAGVVSQRTDADCIFD